MQIDTDLFDDNRGLSTAVGYTALLAVTAILLITILTGANSIVSGQTAIVATDQLETAGATLSAEITTVHRMTTESSDTNTEIVSTVELPEQTVEGQYLIEADTDQLTLTSTASDITVVNSIPIAEGGMTVTSEGRIDGGTVEVCYSGGDEIRVKQACSETTPSEPNTALAAVKDPGEEVRTSGDDVLEFRIENIGTEQATVKQFAVDASGLSESMELNDVNADEIEIRRVTQVGNANRDGSPDAFDATGTQYDFVADSTTSAQYAKIDPDTDDAEVDIRAFSQDIPVLEHTDSASEAAITVTLVLENGNKESFHFK